MGMAASQARFLSLTARKSNVEWEGQQVNQQRTALANESANLFNQLQSIKVPTPPNTSDYYTTVYTFTTSELGNSSKSGTTDYTLESIYNTPQGSFAHLSYMEYNWQPVASRYYQGNISKTIDETTGEYKYSVTISDGSKYDAEKLENHPKTSDLEFTLPKGASIVLGNATMSLNEAGTKITGEDPDGNQYEYSVTSLGDNKYKITIETEKPETEYDNYTINVGGQSYVVTQLPNGKYQAYVPNTNATSVKGAYYDNKGVEYASAAYLENSFTSKDNVANQPILCYNVNNQNYFISATETAGEDYFSASTSIQSIGKKTYKDYPCEYTTSKNGRYDTLTVTDDYGYKHTFSLNVKSVEDEEAYEQAMRDYEYDQQKYQKKIADINAQTEKIQQEDRTLELRLKQLDTEQNALSTEMDAVKKVIEDNVEATFKTFA